MRTRAKTLQELDLPFALEGEWLELGTFKLGQRHQVGAWLGVVHVHDQESMDAAQREVCEGNDAEVTVGTDKTNNDMAGLACSIYPTLAADGIDTLLPGDLHPHPRGGHYLHSLGAATFNNEHALIAQERAL